MSEEHKLSQEELRSHFNKEDAYFHKLDQERNQAARERMHMRRMVCHREGRPPGGCQLVEQHFHGVLVDRCLTCQGVWLDPHELDALAEVLHRETAQPHSPTKGLFQHFIEAIRPTS